MPYLLFPTLSISLIVVWFLGWEYAVVARAVFSLVIASFLFDSRRRIRSTTISSIVFVSFISAYGMLLFLSGLAQVKLGYQGIDFAIFSQLVRNIATDTSATSTLVAPSPVNFLTHHFSPIWILPAIVSKVGIDPRIACLMVHTVCMLAALIFFQKIAVLLHISTSLSRALTILLALHPSIRAGVFWEVREDIIALPLIAGGFFFVFRNQQWKAFFFWLPLLICKETFFVLAPFLGGSGILLHFLTRKSVNTFLEVKAYLLFSILGIMAAGLYFVVLPDRVFHSTFDISGRIVSLNTLFDSNELSRRLEFLVKIFGPLVFTALWSKNSLALSLPAFALLGMGLISDLEAAHNAATYYAVLPTFCLAIAGLQGIADRYGSRELPQNIFLVLLCVALSFHSKCKPASYIHEVLVAHSENREFFSQIDRKNIIISGDYAAQFFIDYPRVYRNGHSLQQNDVGCVVDLIDDEYQTISSDLLKELQKRHSLSKDIIGVRLWAKCRNF